MDDKLKIGILGSRGIPNRYGGFEYLAQELGKRLVERGHTVLVYTVDDHPVRDSHWEGVERIFIKNSEDRFGTFGQFLYDLRCNLDSRKRDLDVILHLGYTSDSIWQWLWTKKSSHVVHMDGLEWRRQKYGRPVRSFLKYAERLATRKGRTLVADNPAIQKYLQKKYTNPVVKIAYGADTPQDPSEQFLEEFGLEKGGYDLVIARMEPENHIEETIRAKITSSGNEPLVIVGNRNRYSRMLYDKYHANPKIQFTGPVYEKEKLDSLRHFCRLYIHGHSAGGTNPSLLEAMAAGCPIAAHKNPFNEAVLGDDAWYFASEDGLVNVLNRHHPRLVVHRLVNNRRRISTYYDWETVTQAYEKLFNDILRSG